jgi:integrase
MAVYKRGGVYWYKFFFKGERVQESARTGNRTTARQIEAGHKTRLAKGEVGIIEKKAAPTLRDFAPKFTTAIETLCASKPATIRFYQSKLDALLKYEPLASCPLDQIEEEAINGYKVHRSRQKSRRQTLYSPASVNRELATLRRLLRLAHEWKAIDRLPRVRLLRGEHGREFVLTQEQEKLYLGVARPDLHNVATLLLDTGLRIGEALSLDWSDVHLEPAEGARLGYIVVRWFTAKNSKTRQVSLTERAATMLCKRGPARSGYVFQREPGVPLYQTYLNEQHAALRKLLKLPSEFVPHSFRHTYGTRLGEAGADAFTIMRLMGHSSVTVSQKYVHPTPETMERAVERLEALNRSEREKETSRVATILATVKKAGAGRVQ